MFPKISITKIFIEINRKSKPDRNPNQWIVVILTKLTEEHVIENRNIYGLRTKLTVLNISF